MEQGKILTLEALIASKEQRAAAKLEYKDVFVPALGGSLTLRKIPATRFAALLGKYDSNNFEENLQFEIELIYTCCPLLQDKALHEAYGVQDPHDIVMKVFDDDLGAMATVAEAITAFYGLGEAAATVKN